MRARDERIIALRHIILTTRGCGCGCVSCLSDNEWAREQLRTLEGDPLREARAAIYATLAQPIARTLPWPFGGAR